MAFILLRQKFFQTLFLLPYIARITSIILFLSFMRMFLVVSYQLYCICRPISHGLFRLFHNSLLLDHFPNIDFFKVIPDFATLYLIFFRHIACAICISSCRLHRGFAQHLTFSQFSLKTSSERHDCHASVLAEKLCQILSNLLFSPLVAEIIKKLW